MADLDIYSLFAAEIEGVRYAGGSRNDPETVTLSGAVFDTRQTVADDYGVATLWASGDGGISTFEVGWLLSDQDLLVELRNDNATAEHVVLEVKAGMPLMLAGEQMDAVEAAPLSDGVQTTVSDSVDRIRVQRNVADDEGDASVRLILFN